MSKKIHSVSPAATTAVIVLFSVLVIAACSGEGESTTSTEDAATPMAGEGQADAATNLCVDMGPQTPRDISSPTGLNTMAFELAPPAAEMNLCNIHTHTNAEHKGPGFAVFAGPGEHGGYACNDRDALTDEELRDPFAGEGAFKGAVPGDTIEVHWVHTSCDVSPGEGLGSCLTETCSDPLLRVEAQVFLVVNDSEALDFREMAYGGTVRSGLHQAKEIPSDTGTPVVFRGSTTGPSYDQVNCSPMKVTWSVRPECARLDIGSLHAWAAAGNVFHETKSHGVRELVTAPELLAPLD